MTNFVNTTISALTAIVAQAAVPSSPDMLETILEKGGASALSAVIIWWLLNRFTKGQDKQTEVLQKQTETLSELKTAVHELSRTLDDRPCIKDKQFEA